MDELDSSSQIDIDVSSAPAVSLVFPVPLSGWQSENLRSRLIRAGLNPDKVVQLTLESIERLNPDSVIVGFGESVLRHFTDRKSIDKWQLSPLLTHMSQRFIPTYGYDRTQKQYELGLYQDKALIRAREWAQDRTRFGQHEERFHLNPGLEETMQLLDEIKTKPELAVDVETGYGQINTVGFAWSPHDAITINVLPSRCGDEAFLLLWSKIRDVLEGPSRLIFQNFIYDTSYFSAYGIRCENVTWDTMWAMKVLWPELKSNLGNVGRFYTRRSYWKDDGKVTDEEGAKKNWGDVRDWIRHYQYNCRDTTGTFESHTAQRDDLRARGLLDFFESYVMRLAGPISEMCSLGMPVCGSTRESVRLHVEESVRTFTLEFNRLTGREINPRSPRQVLAWLKDEGVKLPKKYNKEKGSYQESTDASSIKKVRLKYPRLEALAPFQQIKTLEKALSSYINFDLRADGRLSYSLNGAGTETLRWSGHADAWDRGFNIQTIPREGGDVSIKSMFVAPEGHSFLEIDLRQAESRFVAYDSADGTLIHMLESGADVHTHVGRAIVTQMGRDPDAIPKDEFKSTWRQLGKKAGHGLNYAMKATTFVETVFNELDLVITKKDAEVITKAYYGLFPGIPRWHAWIRNELYNKRKLTAPSGWERYFYGRPGDDMHKEAYAWRPQHTIPWITNNLMLHLCELRKHGELTFDLLVQVHDSLILLAPDIAVNATVKACHRLSDWHPRVTLPGGEMVIPVETKVGKVMSELKEVQP